MSSDIENFLRYWSDPNTKQDDAAFRLAHAHKIATAKLKELRASTLAFLQPGKDSRGRWVPVFDEGKTDEVAALGLEIEKTDKALKQVCNDIIAFMEASEGNPMLTSLANRRNMILDRIKHCEKAAAVGLKRALDKNPHESPAVLMQRADISQAYKDLERAKEETAKPLADMEDRLAKARQIIGPYEREGNARGF
jgi:hypothetical protein